MDSKPRQLTERLDVPDGEIVRGERSASGFLVMLRTWDGRALHLQFDDPNWILDLNCAPVSHVEVTEVRDVEENRLPGYIRELARLSGSFTMLPRFLTIVWSDDEVAMAVATQDYPMYHHASV